MKGGPDRKHKKEKEEGEPGKSHLESWARRSLLSPGREPREGTIWGKMAEYIIYLEKKFIFRKRAWRDPPLPRGLWDV